MNVLLIHLNSRLAASDSLVADFFFFFFSHASELKADLRWLPHQHSRVICAQHCSALCASNMKRKKKKKKLSGAVN